jgi:CubicO group peptidase (beta-lactamase class C family)
MKTSGTFPVLFVLLLLSILSACQNRSNSLESHSFGVNQIDSLLNEAVRNNEIPGAVVYISRSDKEVLYKSYGFRNLENKTPMVKNDIFRMASMTKGLTAVSVLQLNERGLLGLDDKLSKYIPEFANPQILIDVLPDSSFTSKPAKNEITIRQLLTHTSGIGYGFQYDLYNALIIKNHISEGFACDNRTSLDNIRRLAKIPLLCEPGEKYIYSMSYDILGVVIEVVSGMRFDEYITQNILKPLEMNSSYFIVPEKEQYRLVTPYSPVENGSRLIAITDSTADYPLKKDKQYFSGGADLCSTAEDYAKFIQMVKNKGVSVTNTRVVGEKYIEMMLSKQTNLPEGGSTQGFSTWVTNKQGEAEGPMSAGAFGFGGFWDTFGWADPKGDFVAVLLLQMYPGNQYKIHEKFQEITYRVFNGL